MLAHSARSKVHQRLQQFERFEQPDFTRVRRVLELTEVATGKRPLPVATLSPLRRDVISKCGESQCIMIRVEIGAFLRRWG